MTSAHSNAPTPRGAPGRYPEEENRRDLKAQSLNRDLPTRIPHPGSSIQADTPTPGPWEDVTLIPEAEAIRAYWAGPHGTDEYGIKRYTLNVTARCPFCRREHSHGTGAGYGDTPAAILARVAHCAGRHAPPGPARTYWVIGADKLDPPPYPAAYARAKAAARHQQQDQQEGAA